MVHHYVTFKLEGEGVAEAASAFKNALEALPTKIEEIDSMEVFLNDAELPGNWTLMLHAVCPDYPSLAAYAGHPEHLACVAIIKPLVAGRAAVDFEK